MSHPLWNRYTQAGEPDGDSDFDTVTLWANDRIAALEQSLAEAGERITGLEQQNRKLQVEVGRLRFYFFT